jgi:hypothetical protein
MHRHLQAGTLGDKLLRHIQGDDPLTLPLSYTKRVRLEGAELEEWEARHLMEGVEQLPDGGDAGMAVEGGGVAIKQEGGVSETSTRPPGIQHPLITTGLQGM